MVHTKMFIVVIELATINQNTLCTCCTIATSVTATQVTEGLFWPNAFVKTEDTHVVSVVQKVSKVGQKRNIKEKKNNNGIKPKVEKKKKKERYTTKNQNLVSHSKQKQNL